MNVAIFASAFYPSLGGVEELCRQLAAEYNRRGIGVAVFTNRWPRGLGAYEVIDGIEVRRLPFRVPGNGLKAKLSYTLTTLSVQRELFRELAEFHPDVIHVQCVTSSAPYVMTVRRRLGGVPLVVTLQGELNMDRHQVYQQEPVFKRIMRRSLAGADAITACSGQTLAEAEAWFGSPLGDRGRVIYNGISAADAVAVEPWPHPRPYVLAIGRHVAQKGFDLLLEAFARLAGDPAFDHDLILAGDGVEHAGLKALAGKLGLGDRVIFPGRVDHAAAMRLFAGCSFFVLPSRHEPFGIVNLEAMAAGKAIAAARVGGVPEIVTDGENGLLVAPGDVGAMADTIGRLSKDPQLRERLGSAGRARAAGFTWPAIADQYVDLYQRVIRDFDARRPERSAASRVADDP